MPPQEPVALRSHDVDTAKTPALIFLMSFAVLVAAMGRHINVYDEGLTLVGAMRVAHGEVLHRDFYAIYGPAQFTILAGLFKVFGTSILVERVWDTIIRAMVVTVAFLIVRRGGTRREGLFAAGLVLIWMCSLRYYGYGVFPSLLFALLSALYVLPLFDDRRSPAQLFCSGLCIGVTVLFRYDAGFYAFAAVSIVSAFYILSRPLPLRERFTNLLRALLPIYIGVGIVCIPVAVAYILTGTLQDFLFQIFQFPTQAYRRMRTMPFPGLAALLEDPAQIGVYLPFVVCLAALTSALMLRRDNSETNATRPWIMLLLGLLSALFYLKGIVRPALIQLALSIVPALMLSAMLLRDKRSEQARPPVIIATMAALIIVMVPTVVGTIQSGYGMVQNAIWVMQRSTWSTATADTPAALSSCQPVPSLQRAACFEINQARSDAIRYVAAHTKPNDKIYVGLSRHDRVLGNDMLFYFVGGWMPATKWHHFDPGLQTSEKIQSEMIAELKAARTPYVVLESEWEDFDEPNESAISSRVTLLDDFIRANFEPAQVFGKLTVLKAKAG